MTNRKPMHLSRQILEKILTNYWFYIGTMFSISSFLLNHWNLGKSEMPEPFNTNELLSLGCFLGSLMAGAILIYQLRPQFVFSNEKVQATAFCRSFAFFYLKAFALVSVSSLPFVTLLQWVKAKNRTSPTTELSTLEWFAYLGLFSVAALVIVVVHNGGGALVVARGHSRYCIRDSGRSFLLIWREVLLSIALMLLPALATLPFYFLSFHFAFADWITAALDFAFIPYQFALANGSFLFFAHYLKQRDPEFQDSTKVQSVSLLQSSRSEAKSFSTP